MTRDRLAAALIAVAALAAGAAGCRRTPPPAAVLPVDAARVLEAVAERRGKVVLVNVWATWCLPCREEMPDLLRARRELAAEGFELVLVSADFAAQRDAAARFLAGLGAAGEVLWKSQGDQEFIDGLEPRWSGALPLCVLFDRSGARVAFWEEQTSHAELLARVRPLLARAGAETEGHR